MGTGLFDRILNVSGSSGLTDFERTSTEEILNNKKSSSRSADINSNVLEDSSGISSSTNNRQAVGNLKMKNSEGTLPRRDVASFTERELEFRGKLQKKIMNDLNIEDLDKNEIIQKVEDISFDLLKKEAELFKGIDRSRIVVDIIEDLTGFGPINKYLLDIDVSEIMVNGFDTIYIDRKGKLVLTDTQFRDDEHVMNIIKKIVAPLGRRIDESSPIVDARLPDGSRVNIAIPPIALNGPTITIRKFPVNPLTIDDLIKFGTLSANTAMFIDACVKAKLNIFISGGTSSGKTSSLNVFSSFIPDDERIITIEDAAELQLPQRHVVRMEARPANIEGEGAIPIRQLVVNALRQRPDRIIVGEVRSGEALDLLQAMNTGHDGSMGTGHSNSARDMVARLETMTLMSGIELPIKAIRSQIAGALDVIIQQTRLRDGTRRITSITEVLGLEGDVVVLQDIFKFVQDRIDSKGKVVGSMKATGIRPKFYEKIELAGIQLPNDIFS